MMAIEYDYTIDYNEQMLDYYPEVIKAIREFQMLIKTQSLEVEEMHSELTKILENAYIGTADESTIVKWEKMLGIAPSPQGDFDTETWLEDRRSTIAARLYNPEKLNTQSISDIVKIFTGGTAMSYFQDGIIYIYISPPKDNKKYRFENVEREISKKIPAHLSFLVTRQYYTWLQTKENNSTWEDVKNKFNTWEEVSLWTPVWNTYKLNNRSDI